MCSLWYKSRGTLCIATLDNIDVTFVTASLFLFNTEHPTDNMCRDYAASDVDCACLVQEGRRVWCRCDGCGVRIQIIHSHEPETVRLYKWWKHKLCCKTLQCVVKFLTDVYRFACNVV